MQYCGFALSHQFTLHVNGTMSYNSSDGAGNSSNAILNSLNSDGNAGIDEGGIRDPKPREHLFEKELINKQNKRIYVVDDFGPSRNSK